jgi:hypothetical protein
MRSEGPSTDRSLDLDNSSAREGVFLPTELPPKENWI